jgi:hypothetical protein
MIWAAAFGKQLFLYAVPSASIWPLQLENSFHLEASNRQDGKFFPEWSAEWHL